MTVHVPRDRELAWLEMWRDREPIKVVTGVRRCGKSTLLRQFASRLAESGVPADRVVVCDMQDFALVDLLDNAREFHQHIANRLPAEGKSYLFVDEIQLVDKFEAALNSLKLNFDVDIYVTGSNAQMLSSDLATRLAGRYVELHLLPYSLAEFGVAVGQLAGSRPLSAPQLYAQFVRWGGFPALPALLDQPTAATDYLDGLVNTVLVKDVAVRQRVGSMLKLRDVTTFLLSNVGNLTSIKRISDSLTSYGRKPAPNTVESYLEGLTDAFLLYAVRRWDVKGLRYLAGPDKYYAVDPGLRNSAVGYTGGDTGHLLENIVYLELRRRFGSVRVGATRLGEIDFVAFDGADPTYFQVAETVRAPQTLERELRPLKAVGDHNPKYLLTLDAEPPISHLGIRQLNVIDWLTSPQT